jgi:hypothetical protein
MDSTNQKRELLLAMESELAILNRLAMNNQLTKEQKDRADLLESRINLLNWAV